jgi:hypothetical protein
VDIRRFGERVVAVARHGNDAPAALVLDLYFEGKSQGHAAWLCSVSISNQTRAPFNDP